MTISSTTVKNSYNGDGSTTTFSYTFKIFANSDLQVIIRNNTTATETVKTLTTHYTVTGAGSASGGSVIFTAGNIPASGETVVLRRAVPQTQAIDYIANDPFPAESHEEGLDRAMMTLQQVQEEVTRSIKLSRTNTMTSTEFTIGASARAGKFLSFDSNGELVVSQEVGTYQGNWSAGTTYAARDIVKDSSNNNIYLCNTGHTSSGTTPLSSNVDIAKWDLLVDSASATASASAAATSATNAANSATASANSASAAANSESNAATSESNASTSATNAANSATSASNSATTATTQATAASGSATSAASSASTATTQATNAANSATSASGSATTATTQAGIATTQASNASTSASSASTSASNAASSASTATTQATNASNSATSAASSASAAAASAASIDAFYLGALASDPTVDGNGDPITAGDWYFNTSANETRIYNGSTWQVTAISTAGLLVASNNLSDLTSASTARTNLGLGTAAVESVATLQDIVNDTTPQLGGQLDVNGNAIGNGTEELIKFVETASAVNEFTITNNATGNNPILSATGDDTNIGIDITTKGTGTIKFNDLAYYPEASLTSSSNAVAWDSQASPNAKHTTTENTTFSAPTNATTGSFISLNIQYGGSHTIAFNTVFEFAGSTAPTFTSVSGQVDHLVFRYNGTVWQEMGRTLNMSAT